MKEQPKDIKIEKGIAIPPKTVTGRPRIYPFDELKVGESFFVKDKAPEDISACRALAQKRTGSVYVLRSVKGGVRVWRIK